MSKKRKLCPKCESGLSRFERWVYSDGGPSSYKVSYRIFCAACLYSPDHWDEIPEKAAEYWNTRPIEDALRAEVARLTAENQTLRDAARWVPVGERLPDTYRRVFMLDGSNYTRHIGYHVSSIPQWSTVQGVFYHGDSYSWITHWKEIGELPAPEGEA